MENSNRNPIKHVTFSENDHFKPETTGGGGKDIPHKIVTNEFKNSLLSSIQSLTNTVGFQNSTTIAVVELENNAIAKSHRPTEIFNDKTCPFFGDVGYAKHLIQVTPIGLLALKEKISNSNSKKAKKHISAIKSISKYEAKIDANENEEAISVRLFRFNSAEKNQKLDDAFEFFLKNFDCKWKKHPSNKVRLYRVIGSTKKSTSVFTRFCWRTKCNFQ